MGTVYSYSEADWLWMKELRGAIKFMQERNTNGEFSIAIKQERMLLSEEINSKAA